VNPASIPPGPDWRVAFARAIYRRALWVGPREGRIAFRADMIETFDQLSAEAGRRGTWKLARLLGRELIDLVRPAGRSRPGDAARSILAFESHRSLFGRLARSVAPLRTLRGLVRRPGFVLVALLTMGVGTAITTTLFGIVDAVILRPLPYPDADRLVTVYETNPSRREATSLIAPGRLEDWRRRATAFSDLAGSYSESVTDASGAEPERLEARRVSPGFFAVFGSAPLAGRGFVAEEEQAGGPGAAVLSEAFWTRRFGADPGAIGRSLLVGGRQFTIVGVMPREFAVGSTDVWLPAQTPAGMLAIRDARFFNGIGRVKPGVSLEQAAADLASVQRQLGEEFPATDKDWSAVLTPLKAVRVGTQAQSVWLVFAAVVLLWLIAVANVAGLMLVQMDRRARELAIRTAIGASRAEVVASAASDVVVIAVAGGAVGAGVAAWLLRIVPALVPSLPRVAEIGLDWRAVAFACASATAAAIVCGVLPALAATRADVATRLASGGRGASRRSHALQRALVIAQVAMSVVLVGSAVLLLRSYVNLTQVAAGFTARDVVTFRVGARWDEDRVRIGQLQQSLVSRLAEAPGIEAVGFTSFLPFSQATLRYRVTVSGLTGPDTGGALASGVRSIGAAYFAAIGARIEQGAACPALNGDFKARRSAVVNRRFVEAFGAPAAIVGREITILQAGGPSVISGVVADISEDGPASRPVPFVYVCDTAGSWPDPHYVVRADNLAVVSARIRQVVRTLDPGRAVFGVTPLETVLDAAVERPRLQAGLLSVFSGGALALAAVGLYSLFMLLVRERTREIGVRLALGATPARVTRQVLASAGGVLVIGLVAGLGLTLLAGRLVTTLLFGVTPYDPLTLGLVTITLALVAVAAIAGPARRAAQVDPTTEIRADG